jgi:hypothetical protein
LPRKPNYKFERMERDRAKAKKKADRKQAREDRKKAVEGEAPVVEGAEDVAADPTAAAQTVGEQD